MITATRVDLVAVARREQALLTAALASVFSDRDLDTRISRALGYPAWPQPLTLLPDLAPELTTAAPHLTAYLAFAITAGHATITEITNHGWPDSPAAADAAWLLLQHADANNEQRRTLLPALTAAVERGHADPRHLALLTDRECTVRGEGQQYGTLRLIRDDEPALLFPLAGTSADVDAARRAIGLPDLADDAQFAFSPLTPYGAARTCPTNSWQPRVLHGLQPDRIAVPADRPDPLPDNAISVYLGATLRHRNQMRRVRDALPAPLVSTSRWLDIDPLTRASCQLDAGLALNQLAARLCLADVARCDVLIAFAEHRRSHGLGVEIGIALALDKQVIIIGAPRCSFDMLPDVTVVADFDDAVRAAARLGFAAGRGPV
ncbi:DUF6624 domain-containing protein [Nucisporomicrobium flavum]|uniref:DUF6624 domain-containing protein n=1 Tax=Nucisporomicrobium flavum TaxID=2785915 RepID=UPI0018F6A4A6|nr:DUF6624 domain-containing protein [Nucisporomicrobium flavum]